MEETIENISGYGRFQIVATALIGSTSLLNAMAVYSTVFTDAYPSKSSLAPRACLNESISNESLSCSLGANQSEIQICELGSPFGLTSSIEWKLACAHISYSYLLQSFYMIGSLLSIFAGYLSDRFGRKRVTLVLLGLISATISSSQLIISVFDLPVHLKYTIYSMSKFCLGMLCVGLFNVTYVLLFEMATKKKITMVSNINVYLFVVGECIVALLSFVFQSWHVINWFIAGFSLIVFVLSYLFLPESPRYLIVNKRYNDLYAGLKRIYKVNGRHGSFGEMNERDVIDNLLENFNSNNNQNDSHESVLGYIFKSRRSILIRVALISFVWLSLSLVYFGISLGITNVDDINPYLMFGVSSLAEIIGYFMCHLNDKVRRKTVFVAFLTLAGVMCLLVSFIHATMMDSSRTTKLTLLIILVSVGKAMSSAAFNCAYTYTSLMFNTRIRNTLLNFVVGVGRIGGIIAPIINMAGDVVWKQLPYVLFSLTSLLGALFVLILPDPSALGEF